MAHARSEEIAKPRFENRPGVEYNSGKMESRPGDFPGLRRLRAAAIYAGLKRQARNQLGTPEGVKSFLGGAQSFQNMFNSIKLCPTHFSRRSEKNYWVFAPPAPPYSQACKGVRDIVTLWCWDLP